jgi:hypothetical protein
MRITGTKWFLPLFAVALGLVVLAGRGERLSKANKNSGRVRGR